MSPFFRFAKRDKLVEILKEVGTDRTMVFVETNKNADFLAAYLCNEGLPSTSIHGDRLQREREEALGDFKSGKFPIIGKQNLSKLTCCKCSLHCVNFNAVPRT